MRLATTFTPLLLTVALVGCTVSDRQIIDQADQFHGGIDKAVIADRQLNNYIQTIGDRIIEAARQAHRQEIGPKAHFNEEETDWMFSKEMKFHFVNSKTLNAFTTGGEHMYIYTELFQSCKDENDLVAVMAHEYAHVYGRHVQKGTQRQYAIIGTALAIGAAGAVAGGKDHAVEYGTAAGGAALVAGQLLGMGFTRKDEDEADKYGFLFYTRAGWDPEQFGDFFQIMIDKGLDKGSEYLSDHPTLKSRVEKSKERARQLGPEAAKWRKAPVADIAQFRSLQKRAADVGRNMPSDKTLAGAAELLRALPRSCLTPAVQEDQKQAQKDLQQELAAQERRRKK